ncbi:hypothetical protein DP190_21255 [Enterobacter cloacae]|uniref:hypothetical protein n=1 Tax=Enterobacter sp. 148H3 TaxID=3077756 RepID=UPI000DCCE341|nr:hypothetical protein [Enterobacter sp. 148H3]RAY79728.1 hypothetical protein DP190_21255 [Enterobacter cloacae]
MMSGSSLFIASMTLVEQWLGLLIDLGRADATIKAYRGAFVHYLRYCEEKSLSPTDARFDGFSGYIRPQLSGMEHPVASATLQLRRYSYSEIDLKLWRFHLETLKINDLITIG